LASGNQAPPLGTGNDPRTPLLPSDSRGAGGSPCPGLRPRRPSGAAGSVAEMVTLESPTYPLTNVQAYDPPATGAVLPLGLFGFTVTGVPPGGTADVQMVLPNDVYASRYVKQDPRTGV